MRLNNPLKVTFYPWALLLFLLLPLLFLEHGALVVQINQHKSSIADVFFKIITHLGTIYVFIPFFIYFALYDRRRAKGFLLACLMMGGVVYLFKQVILEEALRPTAFFEGRHVFDLIEGIDYPAENSFPSGHTATAFTCILYIISSQSKRYFVWIGFSVALLVGLSRMYLLQHFFVDVYAGAFIGGASALTALLIVNRRKG